MGEQPVPGAKNIHERDLDALNALPAGIHLVSYGPKGPYPKNIWANTTCLQLFGDISLEEFLKEDTHGTAKDLDRTQWEHRYHTVQVRGETILELSFITAGDHQHSVECACCPINYVSKSGESILCTMVTYWPIEVRSQAEANTTYMTSLLQCSPYPLCFFTFDGQLITCNPAARAMFGKTIWLQSDIFGMGERERRGLSSPSGAGPGPGGPGGGPGSSKGEEAGQEAAASFRGIERTERRTAYEKMMDELTREGAEFEVDLPMRKRGDDGSETTWYCRVCAQRQTDPVTREPMIMICYQDVTNLRKVEGELGRMLMCERTNKEVIKQHDSDVAGSLLVLLGEDFGNHLDGLESLDASGHASASWTDHLGRLHLARLHDARAASGGGGPGAAAEGPGAAEESDGGGGGACRAGSSQLAGLRACLEKADEWVFDVFELERESEGRPLQVMTWHALLKHDLIAEFDLDHVKLVNFLRVIESGHEDNPYHNATHVADVVQSMHVLLLKGGFGRFVGPLETLAGLLAACIHDYEHRGFNNDFLIKTSDDWAIDSNDRSPNESHHVAQGMRVLLQPDCNFIHRMPQPQQVYLRKLVIDMVLATDMAEHMAIVSKLKTDLLKRLQNPDDLLADDVPDTLRTLVLQGAIKLADIGHLYAGTDVHVKWSERLEEEMWRQGDSEKARAMKVSFLMDRDKPGVTKSQIGFLDFVVRPLFETWIACFPECKILLDRINANYAYWKARERDETPSV